MKEPAKIRLLLVDDNTENLAAISAVLEHPDYEIITAHSGEDALKQLLKHEFALILLDVQMPEINGFETARLIKQREKSRYIPIIFISAFGKEENYVFEGYSAGAVDYIFKPINPVVLKSKVAVFVDLYRKREALRATEEDFRELLESVQCIVWRGKLNGGLQFVYVSREAESLLGYTTDRWIHQPGFFKEHVHSDDRQAVQANFQRIAEDKYQMEFEFRMISTDGRTIWLRNIVKVRADNGTSDLFGVMVDITQQKYAETALNQAQSQLEKRVVDRTNQLKVANESLQNEIATRERAVQRLQITNNIAGLLIEADTWTTAAPKVLKSLVNHLQWDVGILWSLTEGGSRMRCTEFYSDKSISMFEDYIRQSYVFPEKAVLGRVWSLVAPLWLPRLTDELDAAASVAGDAGLHSRCVVPIHVGRSVHGMLEFYSMVTKPRDDETLMLLRALGQQIGEVIERRRAEVRTSQLVHEVQSARNQLAELSEILATELNEPLQRLNESMQMLSQQVSASADKKLVQQMQDISGRTQGMKKLLDALQHYSNVAALFEEPAQVNTRDMISQALQGLSVPRFVEIDVDPDLPVIIAHEHRLQSTFEQLLKNSLESIGEAPGKISINCSEDPNTWIFSVRDTGKSKMPEQTPTLFRSLKVLSKGETFDRRQIGMALVKEFVESVGGKVWMDSKPGEGSACFFSVPKYEAQITGLNAVG